MKISLRQALTILLVFGAPLDGFSGGRAGGLSTGIAAKIAKAEVKRRGLALPEGTKASVQASFVEIEFRSPQPIFTVTFSHLDRRHRRSNLYQVNVDQKSGKIEDFLDMRSLIKIRQ